MEVVEGWLVLRCICKTVFKQRDPFDDCDGMQFVVRGSSVEFGLAAIDKIFGSPNGRRLARTNPGRNSFQYRVLANTPVPIFGIRKIPFKPMHDGVPETSFGCVDALADRVRVVKEIVQQPCSAQTALGHVMVCRTGWKPIGNRQFIGNRSLVAGLRPSVFIKGLLVDQRMEFVGQSVGKCCRHGKLLFD